MLVSFASRLLLVRCRVLLETHEMEHQRNEHLTRIERVSLLTCSWSILYNFTIGGWAYTTSTLLPMQELSAEEGGGLIIRHGHVIRRTRYHRFFEENLPQSRSHSKMALCLSLLILDTYIRVCVWYKNKRYWRHSHQLGHLCKLELLFWQNTFFRSIGMPDYLLLLVCALTQFGSCSFIVCLPVVTVCSLCNGLFLYWCSAIAPASTCISCFICICMYVFNSLYAEGDIRAQNAA